MLSASGISSPGCCGNKVYDRNQKVQKIFIKTYIIVPVAAITFFYFMSYATFERADHV